jgi:outer membrane protein OmpA-like peptidoglycan-associated protein
LKHYNLIKKKQITMFKVYQKTIAIVAICIVINFSGYAQQYTSDTTLPFSGIKAFRTWSFGINAGALYPSLAIGGTNDFTKPLVSLGYGINIKYQAMHWLAFQLDVLRGKLKGNQDRDFVSHGGGPRLPAFPARTIKSFETEIHYAASLSAVWTMGNINWLKLKNKVIPYLSLGGGIINYKPTIVPRVAVAGGGFTAGPSQLYEPSGKSFNHANIPVGMGLRFGLGRSMNLDLGYRMNFVDTDDLDGYDYADTRFSSGNPSRALHKDKFSYAFLGLEFALGNKAKPQLMFDNPAGNMHHNLQNQVDVLRSQLNLADTDGDGVADIFDKEPNTPAGCPVDTHGVTKDTDGDGVPDCKDQQLITPTECQPVDANGVGKCPPPECCANMSAKTTAAATCTVGDLPSLSFKGNANTLSADTKAILATVAAKLKESPNCAVTITGYPAASKASQAVCNKRTDAIRTYLMNNEGISSDRLSVNCQVGGGDANTIDIKASSK